MSFVNEAWKNADEYARYVIWSHYCQITANTMGPDFPVESYPVFCDAMNAQVGR